MTAARRRTARFRCIGMLGRSRPEQGTIEITPDGIFRLRPYRSRRVYEVTLDGVASMVALRCNQALARERAALRAAKRKARRGA